MPNPRDQKLQQLAAIAQLFGTVQQAQGNQQQNALAQMQLQQQGQWHQGELNQQAAALAQQNQWHQGELQNQQSAQALSGRQGDAQLAELAKYHQGELDLHKAGEANRVKMEFMQHYLSDPNAGSWEQKVQNLGTLDPSFLPMAQGMHQSGVQHTMQQVLPSVQAMYGQYNDKGHDYHKLSEGLKALQPGIPTESWNALPWQEMNQGMTGAAPASNRMGFQAPQRPQDIPADLQSQFQGLDNQQSQQIAAQTAQAKLLEEKKKRQAALNYLYDVQHPGAMYEGSNF